MFEGSSPNVAFRTQILVFGNCIIVLVQAAEQEAYEITLTYICMVDS